MELENLDRPANPQDNTGGIQQKLLVSPISWMASPIPKIMAPWAAAGDSARIVDDYTFNLGYGFVSMELDYKENMFEGDTVADWGSDNTNFQIKGKFYGLSAVVSEMVSLLSNTDLILLAKDLTLGTPQVYNFGTEELPCRKISHKYTSGQPKNGFKGVEFTFEVPMQRLLFYEGAITLKP